MLRSYFAAALRNLMRNKLVSLINVVGLAVGFAAAILIGLYLRYELSFEEFLPGHEQVYRLSFTFQPPGHAPEIMDAGDILMAEYLKLDYPEIEMTARIGGPPMGVRRGNIEFMESGVPTADPDFFRMMPFPVVSGDLATALDSPDGVVITREIARRYFGDGDALGQTLEIDRETTVRVRAVIEDLPGNTQFNFKMVGSSKAKFFNMSADTVGIRPDVFTWGAATYFRLRDGATTARIEADASNFLKRHYAPALANSTTLNIYPLSRVHLSPPGRWPMNPVMNPRTLRTLGLVGLLVILIAVINFVNLMTARAAQRVIEVGVRKSAGARRVDLIAQFLGEACLYVFAAVLVAMALVELALPTFNTMLSANEEIYQEASVTFQYWREPMLAGALLVAALAVGVLAGAYPAFVMSAMRPADALHRVSTSSGTTLVRKWLVILQLAILIALLFATAVIHRQTTFAMDEALRIDHEQIVVLKFAGLTRHDTLEDSIASIPGVSGLTTAIAAPTNYDMTVGNFSHSPGAPAVSIRTSAVDFNFFEFYRLKPLAGRLPSRDRGTDLFGVNDGNRSASVWLNESAVRALGISSPAAAVDESLTASALPQITSSTTVTVSGVIPDFPVDSVRGQILPVVYVVDPSVSRYMSIRLTGKQIPETLAAIEAAWKNLGNPFPITHWFLDQYYHRMYIDIIQQRRVLGSLCGVAVFLACLGLFGLSIYTAQRRTKEIGIRKVMGASTSDVMRLLLWAFSKPVLWASLAAWPVAAWIMNRWLEGFAYRVNLGWWLLPLASLLALVVALATVSTHSYLVARGKPAGALRYE